MNHEELWQNKLRELVPEVPVDDEHQSALRSQILQQFDDAQPTVESAKGHSTKTWRTTVMRLTTFGLSATVLLVLATWLVPSGNAHAGLRNVAEKFLSAKSITFKSRITLGNMPPVDSKTMILGKVVRNEIGPQVQLRDLSQGKILLLVPIAKQATVMKLSANASPEDDPVAHITKIFEAVHASNTPVESLGEKVISGHPALGFRTQQALSTIEVWGDKTTHLPIQIDVTMQTSKAHVSMYDFQLDTPIDEKLMRMEVPTGYTTSEIAVNMSHAGESDLVNSLRLSYELAGKLPDSIDVVGMAMFISESLVKHKDSKDEKILIQRATEIGRGFGWVHALQAPSDAHYAGKDASKDQKDRAVFWYKPRGSSRYRVIFADLSVKDADEAPRVEGAIAIYQK